MKALLFQKSDDMIDYTPAAAVAPGDVIVNNGLIGIATRAIAAGVLGALVIAGVFKVQKANEGFSAFDTVYWNATGNPYQGTAGTGALTETAAGNTYFGIVLKDAAATDTTATVLLVKPKSVTINAPLTLGIADPGNAGAIPVTDSGYVPLVTAGAETRTLAAPSKTGQQVLLNAKTLAGNCVVTCATGLNQTGNNTITFAAAGGSTLLVAVCNGANLRWRVQYTDGGTLSTV